jgi:hypothetical protein
MEGERVRRESVRERRGGVGWGKGGRRVWGCKERDGKLGKGVARFRDGDRVDKWFGRGV